MANYRAIQRTTAPDGTRLELRERDDGNYDIVDLDSGGTVEEIPGMVGRDGAIERLKQTSKNIGRGAELERQRERRSTRSRRTRGGFGDGMSGGGFGGFGLGGDSGSDGGLLGDPGGDGGLFGGFGGSDDSESGSSGVEMERDEQGRFTGRADDECDDDSGGLFGGFL